MKVLKLGSALFAITSLIACGGGGGGGSSNSDTPPEPNNPPTAQAGADFLASRSTSATLDGSASSDPDGDTLTYTWTQLEGPDVTDGAGSFTGVTASFTASETVDTLVFELSVTDGNGGSSTDRININVLENINRAFFVDGFAGNDTTGDGSMESPFSTLGEALSQVSDEEDIYIMTLPFDDFYDETSDDIRPSSGTSLYGGYDSEWNRDVQDNKTAIQTTRLGIFYTGVRDETWVSGLSLDVSDSTSASQDIYGIYATDFASNTTSIHIHDNLITTGDVADGTSYSPGNNYGLLLTSFDQANVFNNNITSGRAGNGRDGFEGVAGDDGNDGNNGSTANDSVASGGAGTAGANGGNGGAGGRSANQNGGDGGDGNDGTAPLTGGVVSGGNGGSGGSGNDEDNGSNGSSGSTGGRGIPATAGVGSGNLNSIGPLFTNSNGSIGGRGGHGGGGGGGGGGEAGAFGGDGVGGGGGGEGGEGGFGGSSADGGGASVGVWLYDIAIANIDDNEITSGTGGIGGKGGVGGAGGSGGSGGSGATAPITGGGDGGNGAVGGAGGRGGYGGSGGGGPSYGIFIGEDMSPSITNNIVTSGQGGAGGESFSRGNAGQGGFSVAVFDLNPDDGTNATLSDNTLSFTGAGAGGEGGGTDGAVLGAEDGDEANTNF